MQPSIYLSNFYFQPQQEEEMMKNLLIDLPEDLFINNILLSKVLLPIKSLLSLRCVCKYLRNLITSTAFINMHLHHSTSTPTHQLNNQLVLIRAGTPYDVFYSLKFNDGDDPCRPEVIMFDYPVKYPTTWGSCNGLLCLTDYGDDDDDDEDEDEDNIVCLWNPLTKEYKDLPPPLPLTKIPIGNTKDLGSIAYRFYSKTYGFGYDRFIDDYKIIRCQHLVEKFNDGTTHGHVILFTEFQVYTLGTNTWRKISSDKNPYKSYFGQPFDDPMHFLNGALHMIMSKSKLRGLEKLSERAEAKIVSFDIEKEVFGEMQWPLSMLHYSTSEVRVLSGCLCVLEFDKNVRCCNVWMMMDYGVNESWTKLFTIVENEVEYLRHNKYTDCYYNLLRFCDNGDILIGTKKILFFYDPISNQSRRVKFGESDMFLYGSEICIYIESLVSLNTGVYKGKAKFQDKDEERRLAH